MCFLKFYEFVSVCCLTQISVNCKSSAEIGEKMERKKPVSGEFYQHFKGKLYQVKMLARDSETQREIVVYQAMYAPYDCWVRDLDEFMSLVDKEKYPQETQKYRFEHVTFQNVQAQRMGTQEEKEVSGAIVPNTKEEEAGISDEMLIKALKTGQPERYLEHKITEEEIANRGLMQLLDAETFHEKRQIFIGLKQYLDKHMLSNIAVAFDIVLEEGDVEMQYDSIMRCMEAFERYEGGRLR